MNQLKYEVETILREQELTRNSDIALTIAIWKRFYPTRIRVSSEGNEGILLRDLYVLPREDNVKRIRAKFNAEHKYLPMEWKVAKQRGIKELEWREYLGYPI